MIRILHTSDVQLDATLGFLGERAPEQRRRLLTTFERILALAVDGHYDLVVIAGDLFDTPRPTEATLTRAQRACGANCLPIAILPGNHDHYGQGSVYRDSRWPSNVHIMDGQPWQPAGLDLLVHGHPLASAHDSRPLNDVTRSGDCQFEIALAHGNYERADFGQVSRPISAEALRVTGMDYVALGDWHAPAEYSQSSVKAWYSGAPEPTAFSQADAGYVLDVRLDDTGVSVNPVQVGESRAQVLELDATGLTAEQVETRITQLADPLLMLDVHIYGAVLPGELVDVNQLAARIEASFFSLRISDDAHVLAASLEDIEREGSPLRASYVRLMRARMQEAVDETERYRLERALALGLALLDGKRVLS